MSESCLIIYLLAATKRMKKYDKPNEVLLEPELWSGIIMNN